MEILWVGGLALPDRLGNLPYPINNPGPVAATNVQKNIIDGIEEQFDASLRIINDYPVDFFPNFRKMFLHRGDWTHNGRSKDINVGFINFPLLRHLSKALTIRKAVRDWANKRKGNKENYIIIYTVHTPYLVATHVAKKILDNVKICLICPDLPEYMDLDLKEKPFKFFLKKIDRFIMSYYLTIIDYFVLFSEGMGKHLKVGNRKSIVMEGVINPKDIQQETVNKQTSEKVILYTGMTQRKYGIIELLEAFAEIKDPDIKLWITGDGNARNEIIAATTKDKRIIWFGFIQEREKVLKLQTKATILVNMRKPSEDASQYTFPSKVLEYMLSSTPVVSFKIKGIPEEYYDHMFTLEQEDPSYIAKRLVEIMDIPEEDLKKKGQSARNFILKNKNYLVQSKKIMNLLTESTTA